MTNRFEIHLNTRVFLSSLVSCRASWLKLHVSTQMCLAFNKFQFGNLGHPVTAILKDALPWLVRLSPNDVVEAKSSNVTHFQVLSLKRLTKEHELCPSNLPLKTHRQQIIIDPSRLLRPLVDWNPFLWHVNKHKLKCFTLFQQVDQILHGAPEDGRPSDRHNPIREPIQREQSLYTPLASQSEAKGIQSKNIVLWPFAFSYVFCFQHQHSGFSFCKFAEQNQKLAACYRSFRLLMMCACACLISTGRQMSLHLLQALGLDSFGHCNLFAIFQFAPPSCAKEQKIQFWTPENGFCRGIWFDFKEELWLITILL